MLKITSLFTCLIISIVVHSQTYNTTVKSAKTISIYGNGKVSIGKIIINQSIRTKIYLYYTKEIKTDSGTVLTTFKFKSNDNLPLFGINIKFLLNVEFIKFLYDFGSGSKQYDYSTNDKKSIVLHADSMESNSDVSITIETNKTPFIIINGIDGKLN